MSTRQRLLFGIASQALSSFSNFVVVIAVANTQAPDYVGAWALAMAAVTLTTALTRAAIATPVVLNGAAGGVVDTRGGFTLATSLGAAAAFILLILGWCSVIPFAISAMFAAACIVIMAQDFLRYTWIARGQPQWAAMLDGVWLVVQAGLLTAVLSLSARSGELVTGTWVIGAVASLAAGIAVDRDARLSVASVREYLLRYRSESRRLFAEAFANFGSANLQPYVVAAVLGYATAGALRITQTLFAPLSTLMGGLNPVILRELSQRRSQPWTIPSVFLRWNSIFGALAAAYGLALVLMPASLGELLAGQSWALVSLLIPPIAVHSLLRPFQMIANINLRAHRHLTLLQNASWAFFIPSLILPATLGYFFGTSWVGWGIVVDALARTIFFWACSRRLTKR